MLVSDKCVLYVVMQQRDVRQTDRTSEDNARQVFSRIAGSDGEVDAYELQTILNTIFMKGQLTTLDPT